MSLAKCPPFASITKCQFRVCDALGVSRGSTVKNANTPGVSAERAGSPTPPVTNATVDSHALNNERAQVKIREQTSYQMAKLHIGT
ncbi:hypothetical protein OPQ81_002397 [Rhizoctonia solani]|nr:hypothetical protein OPQ81_002397 [Rhizoctonia solani]